MCSPRALSLPQWICSFLWASCKPLKNGNYTYRTGCLSFICQAAVIDCLVAKFLDLSAIAAHESKKAQIVPCHIQLGTLVDEDLNKLFQAVTICEG